MMDRPSIISSIARTSGDFSRYLLKHRLDLRGIIPRSCRQRLGDNLAGIGIDPQMQLAPGAPFRPSLLTHLPFPFTEDFQPTAIDDQMNRFLLRAHRQLDLQLRLPTRQRRVAGGLQIDAHQGKQRSDQSLTLTQAQIEQLTQGQGRLDGQVRVEKLSASLGRSLVVPAGKGVFTQPHPQASPINQCLIVRRPVADSVDHFLRRASLFLARRPTWRYLLFHHRLLGKRGKVFLGRNSFPNLNQKPVSFQCRGLIAPFVQQSHSQLQIGAGRNRHEGPKGLSGNN